ncbi:MAG: glycoside hydrolase family 3 N-terminal domain-containing protein, partial [Candidatus Promineifilaceae bacterium]
AQEPEDEAASLFEQMSVDERIGQLFLITFEGDSLDPDSDIVELIAAYKVGGVILLQQNDNLTGYGEPENTPQQLRDLTNALQALALLGELPQHEADEEEEPPQDGTPVTPVPTPSPAPVGLRLPLFIAMSHDGQAKNGETINGGFTAVPTNMAMGATWDPVYARRIGRIVGQELSAAGINMLLGPTLDVLESPAPLNPADLGTRTFGGDPYWVGRMGQAYISGVHEGSDDRLAVIARNFPGKGSSDRLTDEEVPTVRKSLEQLKQIELAPFVAVTGEAPDEMSIADGLLSTHIRYQGFQGNIRATTAPVSLDPQALNTLMALPQFSAWRANGGLLVSDSLGTRSVERFYDDTEQEFPHRRVAKDALLAGNDLLYLHDFTLGPSASGQQVENIKDTIVWFREKYETDQSFRQRVDDAVMNILRRKLALYGGDWSAANVLAEEGDLAATIGNGDAAVFDLAQASTTLISPSASELIERMATAPTFGDSIVIFTDVRESQQCSSCPEDAPIGKSAIADRLLALYGPEASNQISANQVTSFTFDDLVEFLDAGSATIVLPTVGPTPTFDPDATGPATPFYTPTPSAGFLVQEALREADWIIFGLLDGEARSEPLSRFLAERADLVRSSRVIVFGFDAPYYLDTTDISKLTAYYGIYSPVDMFVDTAVRTLFMEAPLDGKSPVSIDGISYNLFTFTQPNPEQIIELYIASDEDALTPPSQEPLDADIGDTLRLETGVIVDRNGNQVPDGTMVQFIRQDRIQGTVNIISESPTVGGVSRLDYVLEASTGPGQYRITAASGAATISQAVDISIEDEAEVVVVVPTAAPTATATASPTPTQTPEPTATLTPVPPTMTPAPPPEPLEPGIRIELSELEMLLSMLSGLLMFVVGTLFLTRDRRGGNRRTAAMLWGLVGGLAMYIYALLQMPGTAWFSGLGAWAGIAATLSGAVIGWALYQLLTGGALRAS